MDPGTIGLLGGIAGSAIGVFGASIGTYFSIKNTRTSLERRFVVKCALGMWVSGILLIVLPLALSLTGVIPIWFYSITYALFFVVLVPTILWANKRQAALRENST